MSWPILSSVGDAVNFKRILVVDEVSGVENVLYLGEDMVNLTGSHGGDRGKVVAWNGSGLGPPLPMSKVSRSSSRARKSELKFSRRPWSGR